MPGGQHPVGEPSSVLLVSLVNVLSIPTSPVCLGCLSPLLIHHLALPSPGVIFLRNALCHLTAVGKPVTAVHSPRDKGQILRGLTRALPGLPVRARQWGFPHTGCTALSPGSALSAFSLRLQQRQTAREWHWLAS